MKNYLILFLTFICLAFVNVNLLGQCTDQQLVYTPEICVNNPTPYTINIDFEVQVYEDPYGYPETIYQYREITVKRPNGTTAIVLSLANVGGGTESGSYTFSANYFNVFGNWTFEYLGCSGATIKKYLSVNGADNTIGSYEIVCNGGGTPALITSTSLNSNTAYTIKWQNSLNGSTWSDIGSANQATYQPPYISVTTHYRRIVTTNSLGCVSTSSPVKKEVLPVLNGGSISGTQNVCYGESPAQLLNTASPSGGYGSGYSYVWQRSINNVDFSDIVGSPNFPQYFPSFVQGTSYYRRKVVDVNCGVAFSNSVTVVGYPQVIAAVVGSNQSICYNTQPAVLSILTNPSGGNGTFTNQWQVSTDGTNFSNIPSATGNSYLPPVLTSSTWYRVVSTTLCKTVTSNSIKINVYNPLTSGTIGNAQSICYNSAPSALSFTVSPSGGDGFYS